MPGSSVIHVVSGSQKVRQKLSRKYAQGFTGTRELSPAATDDVAWAEIQPAMLLILHRFVMRLSQMCQGNEGTGPRCWHRRQSRYSPQMFIKCKKDKAYSEWRQTEVKTLNQLDWKYTKKKRTNSNFQKMRYSQKTLGNRLYVCVGGQNINDKQRTRTHREINTKK